jgi:fructose-1,6-bisphosphatase class II
MDRNYALEFVRVTEAAAIAAARLMGRGNEKACDQEAVDAMRRTLDSIYVDGTVVIGEGEMDEAPMLYIGEKVGAAIGEGPAIDIALDPLEGTTVTALGRNNAMSVIAVAESGNFLHAPDMYMRKIAVGPEARGAIDMAEGTEENLRRISQAKRTPIEDLTVIILDRPRHESLIREVREAGARIKLITDGDVSAAIATCEPRSGIDVLMGIGGAPEGVIAAAALRCVGGDMQGQLHPTSEAEISRARTMGIEDIHRFYTIDELAGGDVMFAATGVTDGEMLRGVRFSSRGAQTHSVVMRSKSGTVRRIEADHHFDRKPVY